ncbi:uncharacterized protein MONOS_8145 [Monocercomonoides exilis]|uniref:uncharacterized protein n=1 Tax=Monocercomonoides exilis TaxID=2049356 RepID=UPI003559966B|nr:hypothetical protein MONOS_8145 [Monocercomonoides exilis]|eukprot:MONOS_8145.1-p1 / transcript=MONOS_8145.1 / gene=MONOS_8145 / organism=Monocercomonoides_exilis_PA203 / gene_product=unspecified product / transcript_product=unspecified product / location=Mono_scaffold00298:46753-47697(-) / protein_length=315 / sequence_SO=supercontig / SO=protein_coding / is_pseudo=false
MSQNRSTFIAKAAKTTPFPPPSPSPQPKQSTSGRGAFGTIHFTRGKRMDGGWRGVGGRALIVYSQEMEMGRGAVGAPSTPLSPAVGGGGIGIGIGGGGGGVTLCVMGMKDLNKEVTRAMQDEFQNEKGKVDDEEAKITFNSLESDDQREKLLRLMKLQEIQKKKKEKEEKERKGRRKKKKTRNRLAASKEYYSHTLRQAHRPTRRRTKMASEEQQEAKESQTPILTRERKLYSMLNDLAYSNFEDLSDEPDVPCRNVHIKSEEKGQCVWKMRKVPVYAAVDVRQTRARLDLMSALKSVRKQSRAELRRGSRRNA